MAQPLSTPGSYAAHLRSTLLLSIPVMVGQLGHVLMGFVDNLMIGRLGYVYLSAASLANGVFFIQTVIGMGMTYALAPMIAEAVGAGKPRRAGLIFDQGVWASLVVGSLLTLLVYGSASLLPLLGQPVEDVALADDYLRIISLSVLPMMLFMAGKQMADGHALTLPAMVITLIGLAFNVVANWLLIYGVGVFPRLELNGAGYATLLSRILMMVLMLGYLMWSRRFRIYGILRRALAWHPGLFRRVLALGLPSGFQYFFEVGAFIGAVVMIGWMDNGSLNRAAHQIAIQLASLTYMVVTGISAAAAIRVGEALGRRQGIELRRAGMSGILLGLAFMLVSALVFLVARRTLVSWFTTDAAVVEIAVGLMLLAAAFQLFDGVQAVGVGILRGMQDVRIPTLITFVVYWVLALPVGYLLAFPLGLGLDGIWYSFVGCLGLAALLLSWRFWRLTGRMMQHAPASSGVAVSA
ncbi:MAG: MATE family efflux transporter [Bacteroidia bacterium]